MMYDKYQVSDALYGLKVYAEPYGDCVDFNGLLVMKRSDGSFYVVSKGGAVLRIKNDLAGIDRIVKLANKGEK